jgi:hypothetical protein
MLIQKIAKKIPQIIMGGTVATFLKNSSKNCFPKPSFEKIKAGWKELHAII